MPYTKQDVEGMENDTLLRRFRSLDGAIAANEAVGHDTPQDIRTNISMLENEIRYRMNDGLNFRRQHDPESYNFSVYSTQGGGLARPVGDEIVFITKPDAPGLNIGDIVPHKWESQPANQLARDEREKMYRDQILRSGRRHSSPARG